MTKIETKFDVGDTVYVIKESRREIIEPLCELCNNTGLIERCPTCQRRQPCPKCPNPRYVKYENYWYYTSFRIERIEISVDSEVSIAYCRSLSFGDTEYCDEHKIVSTQEEAQAICDERNNKNV